MNGANSVWGVSHCFTGGGVVTSKPTLNDIHNPSFEARVLDLLRGDTLSMIERFGDQFLDTPCPVCSSSHRHLEATVWNLDYQRCETCGLVYISPCPPNEIRCWYLANSKGLKFWRESMPAATTSTRRSLYVDRATFVDQQTVRFAGRRQRLVEVGAGNGELAEVIRERNLFSEVILIEPQPLSLSLPGCRVIQSELASAHLTELADVVLAFEVLEHINDPKAFLQDIGKLLGEDGLLVMSTPNVDGLEIRCLGGASTAMMFDHVRLFSPASIRYFLELEGWELLSIETPGEFDIDIIRDHIEAGLVDLTADPALRFICKSDAKVRSEFQGFLQSELLSSHMKFVARKRRHS